MPPKAEAKKPQQEEFENFRPKPVRALDAALEDRVSATPTGQRGLGCPACIQEREENAKALKLLKRVRVGRRWLRVMGLTLKVVKGKRGRP